MSGGANHSRLTGIVYPDGMTLSYNYASGLDDAISRLSSISDTSGTLESYSYLGLGMVVIRGHSQPGVDLTYVKQSGESNGDAGDQYTGLDRFGRVVNQRWRATGYDNLNQITSFDRGALNANKDGISGSPTRQQGWDFDALGNFDSVTTDGSTETRSHNDQNEITSISGATTPTYDANGNMTGDENGNKFVFDAWNRLVTVKDSSNNVLESFAYDGVNRRASTTASSTTTDLYYSAEWQVLEERVGGNTTMQYVWSPVYIDAMILRDRDTDANGSLDERLWVQQDANFNVTALTDNNGNVVERYAYDPFGAFTTNDANWNLRSAGTAYSWVYFYQGGRFNAIADLYNFRFRDYSASLGRWVQRDPIGYKARDVNLNRHEANNPMRHRDPSGLFWPLLLGILGLGAVAVETIITIVVVVVVIVVIVVIVAIIVTIVDAIIGSGPGAGPKPVPPPPLPKPGPEPKPEPRPKPQTTDIVPPPESQRRTCDSVFYAGIPKCEDRPRPAEPGPEEACKFCNPGVAGIKPWPGTKTDRGYVIGGTALHHNCSPGAKPYKPGAYTSVTCGKCCDDSSGWPTIEDKCNCEERLGGKPR